MLPSVRTGSFSKPGTCWTAAKRANIPRRIVNLSTESHLGRPDPSRLSTQISAKWTFLRCTDIDILRRSSTTTRGGQLSRS
ncbi:hypothetical protein FFLO_03913 [Filobasidium floriforme]|uniref:Uncharacterized protein n=1 Tax=Filobasidium floriforme TaxID=5210 RepID=A0A8K0NPS8_9TREE|nr:hypothetical protein FFLO_03913 [Filobasidium floriforme]